jgi:glutamate formiminotransferase/formiminotetrahydrofolate cyclodeaminase
MILENRLASVMGGKTAIGGLRAGIEPFIEQLAAPTAVPGGGSAAAASGAMAAGLVAMVAGMSRGKKAYAAFESDLSAALAELNTLREALKECIDLDADSYETVVTAYKTQKSAPADDSASAATQVAAALRHAAHVPLVTAQAASRVGQIAKSLQAKTNPRMASDLIVAIALSRAAVDGALANVEINLDSIEAGAEAEFVASARARVAELRADLP